MKAAGLSHQYLTVKSFNENDSYFGNRRLRALRKKHGSEDGQKQNEDQLIPSGPASDPLSRRAATIEDSPVPSVTIYQRSASDSTNPTVVYERTPPSNKAKYQSLEGGI